MLLWLKNLGQAASQLAEAPLLAPALGVQSAIHSRLGTGSSLHLGVGTGSRISSATGLSGGLTDSPTAVKSELE